MKVMFLNYYRDSDPKRMEEFMYCLNRNLSLSYIDKFVIFIENMDYKNDIINDKIDFIYLPRRMEFADCIKYSNENLPDNTIIIITLLDIYLEESSEWAQIDSFFDGTRALVLTRHNLDPNLKPYKEQPYWINGNFCDTWIMKTPFPTDFLKEDLEFCVGGAPQCDNLMMYLMTKYWHTYSWGDKYKTYHYDVHRKGKRTMIIYNDKTDLRASLRKSEHINIPTGQNWEYKLATNEQPIIRPCWPKYIPNYLKPIQ